MYLPIYPFFMYWYTEVSIINDSVNDKALWEALRSNGKEIRPWFLKPLYIKIGKDPGGHRGYY